MVCLIKDAVLSNIGDLDPLELYYPPMRLTVQRLLLILWLAGFGFSNSVWADDWPQWQGTNRDAISQETGLMKTWPADGPKLAWRVDDLGGGDSTPSIANGHIFIW